MITMTKVKSQEQKSHRSPSMFAHPTGDGFSAGEQGDLTQFEQEELICSMLSQHLQRHARSTIPDIKPLWAMM